MLLAVPFCSIGDLPGPLQAILGPNNLAFKHGPAHKAIRKSFLALFTRKALGTYLELQDAIIRRHLELWSQTKGEREIRNFVRCAPCFAGTAQTRLQLPWHSSAPFGSQYSGTQGTVAAACPCYAVQSRLPRANMRPLLGCKRPASSEACAKGRSAAQGSERINLPGGVRRALSGGRGAEGEVLCLLPGHDVRLPGLPPLCPGHCSMEGSPGAPLDPARAAQRSRRQQGCHQGRRGLVCGSGTHDAVCLLSCRPGAVAGRIGPLSSCRRVHALQPAAGRTQTLFASAQASQEPRCLMESWARRCTHTHTHTHTCAQAGQEPRCLMDFWAQRCLEEVAEAQAAGQPLPEHSTDHEMADTVMDFLFASQDASTSSLVWMICLMADRPEMLAKVRSVPAARVAASEPVSLLWDSTASQLWQLQWVDVKL